MKREEKLLDSIGEVGGDLVMEAKEKGKPAKKWWIGPLAAVLAVAVLAGVLRQPRAGEQGSVLAVQALAVAEYPELKQMPVWDSLTQEEIEAMGEEGLAELEAQMEEWYEQRQERREAYRLDGVDLSTFLTNTIPTFLGEEPGENRVYSPLNVYLALAMLAETTDGTSRQQILDLLGEDSLESLQTSADALWNTHYINDGTQYSLLASSLWLNEDVTFRQETLDTLAASYHASCYQGAMGTADMDQALGDWINEQTGKLLEEQVGGITLPPETVLALVSTIQFGADWETEFDPEQTEAGTFHGSDGDRECQFMHQSGDDLYYWGDHFAAVQQGLNGGGSMWFVLPDEDTDVESLLTDAQVQQFILNRNGWENYKQLIVNRSIPKFDVQSQLDLETGLRELGVTDVFDGETADFGPLTEDLEGVCLSEARHGARVTIDEEGCTAAAYTLLVTAGAAMPPDEEVDFVLDRPFLFFITSSQGLPLFVGIVHQP